MTAKRLATRIRKVPAKADAMISLCGRLASLAWGNRISKSRLTAPGGPVVSLTSFGRRIRSVYLAIESIGRGKVLPSRLILWLNEREMAEHTCGTLRRLQSRGLEVRPTEDFGPHKKYYPFVSSAAGFDVPLVTADDDTLYPDWWLERLVAAYQQRPDVVNCVRARVVEIGESGMGRYGTWMLCRQSAKPSFRNFAVGASGILYPPRLLAELKRAGPAFLDCCPRADDIWLHANALRHGFRVRQIEPEPHLFPTIPNTQGVGLKKANMYGSRNDEYIRATYTPQDMEILVSDDLVWPQPETAGAMPPAPGRKTIEVPHGSAV